mmetsp:Transcript_1971/g.4564  ORF Transcript_1971/g.4564 Transcript_1971/m.4564 type:complete len:1345 (+) Transcript_1971:367-4401(+)
MSRSTGVSTTGGGRRRRKTATVGFLLLGVQLGGARESDAYGGTTTFPEEGRGHSLAEVRESRSTAQPSSQQGSRSSWQSLYQGSLGLAADGSVDFETSESNYDQCVQRCAAETRSTSTSTQTWSSGGLSSFVRPASFSHFPPDIITTSASTSTPKELAHLEPQDETETIDSQTSLLTSPTPLLPTLLRRRSLTFVLNTNISSLEGLLSVTSWSGLIACLMLLFVIGRTAKKTVYVAKRLRRKQFESRMLERGAAKTDQGCTYSGAAAMPRPWYEDLARMGTRRTELGFLASAQHTEVRTALESETLTRTDVRRRETFKQRASRAGFARQNSGISVGSLASLLTNPSQSKFFSSARTRTAGTLGGLNGQSNDSLGSRDDNEGSWMLPFSPSGFSFLSKLPRMKSGDSSVSSPSAVPVAGQAGEGGQLREGAGNAEVPQEDGGRIPNEAEEVESSSCSLGTCSSSCLEVDVDGEQEEGTETRSELILDMRSGSGSEMAGSEEGETSSDHCPGRGLGGLSPAPASRPRTRERFPLGEIMIRRSSSSSGVSSSSSSLGCVAAGPREVLDVCSGDVAVESRKLGRTVTVTFTFTEEKLAEKFFECNCGHEDVGVLSVADPVFNAAEHLCIRGQGTAPALGMGSHPFCDGSHHANDNTGFHLSEDSDLKSQANSSVGSIPEEVFPESPASSTVVNRQLSLSRDSGPSYDSGVSACSSLSCTRSAPVCLQAQSCTKHEHRWQQLRAMAKELAEPPRERTRLRERMPESQRKRAASCTGDYLSASSTRTTLGLGGSCPKAFGNQWPSNHAISGSNQTGDQKHGADPGADENKDSHNKDPDLIPMTLGEGVEFGMVHHREAANRGTITAEVELMRHYRDDFEGLLLDKFYRPENEPLDEQCKNARRAPPLVDWDEFYANTKTGSWPLPNYSKYESTADAPLNHTCFSFCRWCAVYMWGDVKWCIIAKILQSFATGLPFLISAFIVDAMTRAEILLAEVEELKQEQAASDNPAITSHVPAAINRREDELRFLFIECAFLCAGLFGLRLAYKRLQYTYLRALPVSSTANVLRSAMFTRLVRYKLLLQRQARENAAGEEREKKVEFFEFQSTNGQCMSILDGITFDAVVMVWERALEAIENVTNLIVSTVLLLIAVWPADGQSFYLPVVSMFTCIVATGFCVANHIGRSEELTDFWGASLGAKVKMISLGDQLLTNYDDHQHQQQLEKTPHNNNKASLYDKTLLLPDRSVASVEARLRAFADRAFMLRRRHLHAFYIEVVARLSADLAVEVTALAGILCITAELFRGNITVGNWGAATGCLMALQSAILELVVYLQAMPRGYAHLVWVIQTLNLPN